MRQQSNDELIEILKQILSSQERAENRMDKVDMVLIEQQSILKEHIRRTELLEARLDPIDTTHKQLGGCFKLFGALGTVGALLLSYLSLKK